MANTPSFDVLRGDWQVLKSSAPITFASLPILGMEHIGARIAVDAHEARHLLVRTTLPIRAWSETESPLKDAVRALAFAGKRDNYLDLRCANPRLFDVFDELVLNVLEAGTSASDAGAAIDALVGQWRAMFRAVSTAGFGKDRRYGLFAELTVLEACVEHVGAFAIDMWTGPSGRPHDFELPSGCLEVKAVGAVSTDITIHGFDQLNVERDSLDLLVFNIAESAEGRTIAESVMTIENHVGAGALNEALAQVGYSTSGPDERLVITDSFVVPVTSQLPALTPLTVAAVVRAGISHIEYNIPTAVLVENAGPQPVAAVIASRIQS